MDFMATLQPTKIFLHPSSVFINIFSHKNYKVCLKWGLFSHWGNFQNLNLHPHCGGGTGVDPNPNSFEALFSLNLDVMNIFFPALLALQVSKKTEGGVKAILTMSQYKLIFLRDCFPQQYLVSLWDKSCYIQDKSSHVQNKSNHIKRGK